MTLRKKPHGFHAFVLTVQKAQTGCRMNLLSGGAAVNGGAVAGAFAGA